VVPVGLAAVVGWSVVLAGRGVLVPGRERVSVVAAVGLVGRGLAVAPRGAVPPET